jgi:hypothetical protein
MKVAEHIRCYFEGHVARSMVWRQGPMETSHPNFYVLEIAPGPRSAFWNYVSVGATDFEAASATKLEFVLTTSDQSQRGLELVTMVAWYHSTEGLDLGHTMPIGEPWLQGSSCNYFLISLPYPYGPELEVMSDGNDRANVLWMLPITKAECDYKVTHGLEALERLFDSNALEYWAADRKSVVFDGTG